MIGGWLCFGLAMAGVVTPQDETYEEIAPVGPVRTAPPPVIPPAVRALALPEEFQIGKVKVHLVKVPGSRKAQVQFIVGRGSMDLASGPSAATDLLFEIQDRATQSYGTGQVSDLVAEHHFSVSSWGDLRYSGVDLETPLESLELGISLAAEVLREPRFVKKELDRERRETLQWYEGRGIQSTAPPAARALTHAWFTPDSPYGRRPDLDGLRKLKVQNLEALHQELLQDAPLDVLVVGDVDRATVEPWLTAAVSGMGSDSKALDYPPDPAHETRIVAIHLGGVTQSAIRLRTGAPLASTPDEPAFHLLDFATGGSFLSRLNSNLREDKGMTYSASSKYTNSRSRAHWTVTVDVPIERTVEAMQESQTEFSALVTDGLTPGELAAARNSKVSEWNMAMQTSGTAVGMYSGAFYEGLTISDYTAFYQGLDGVTSADTQRAAATYWAEDKPRLWVVVGDMEVLEPQFEAAGLLVEWMSPTQAVLGTFR